MYSLLVGSSTHIYSLLLPTRVLLPFCVLLGQKCLSQVNILFCFVFQCVVFLPIEAGWCFHYKKNPLAAKQKRVERRSVERRCIPKSMQASLCENGHVHDSCNNLSDLDQLPTRVWQGRSLEDHASALSVTFALAAILGSQFLN